jgi:hypothetical protein
MRPLTPPDNQISRHSPATAGLRRLTLPGQMLQRGFWLYTWKVETPIGERLYVGRTGDCSSPHATAPYTRMGQHLSFSKAENSLRRLLIEAGIEPESCRQFDLISYGPIFPEIGLTQDQHRANQMVLHTPVRDQMAALEKKLRDTLVDAGYNILNIVHSKKKFDAEHWHAVRNAFAEHFPNLRQIDP